MTKEWKIALIQPAYPDYRDISPSDTVQFILQQARELQEETDVLVLPEYANSPGIDEAAQMVSFVEGENRHFLQELCEIAKIKNTHIAVNMLRKRAGDYYNTTVWIGRDGAVLTEYEKTHLTEYEASQGVKPGEGTQTVEIEGITVSFATCFELYFPEYFEKIATTHPDVIIVPTYQRSEARSRIIPQAQVRAMDSGAFLIRSSYSMGEGSEVGGQSLLVDPQGEVICNANAEVGTFYAHVDLKSKWMRPRSHGQEITTARAIIEDNRRPELYRS